MVQDDIRRVMRSQVGINRQANHDRSCDLSESAQRRGEPHKEVSWAMGPWGGGDRGAKKFTPKSWPAPTCCVCCMLPHGSGTLELVLATLLE